jgi:hypothetical protein
VTDDDNVRIIGEIDLTKPDSSEPDWVVDGTALITFTPTGTFEVLVEGSTNGFSDENENWTIATIPAASITSGDPYNLPYDPVDDKISDSVRVRVSDNARQTEVTDKSFDTFRKEK